MKGVSKMTLDELLWRINDNTIIRIYSSATGILISEYDGKNSIDEELNYLEVTDIFVEDNALCIEIES